MQLFFFLSPIDHSFDLFPNEYTHFFTKIVLLVISGQQCLINVQNNNSCVALPGHIIESQGNNISIYDYDLLYSGALKCEIGYFKCMTSM